mmetsp:Transcript_74716/g.198289  ORF Transcript_74716/g.198289 Transcript_74716/m.198289 type:complete len:359 (-) Transcript_74716:88-1164(-)
MLTRCGGQRRPLPCGQGRAAPSVSGGLAALGGLVADDVAVEPEVHRELGELAALAARVRAPHRQRRVLGPVIPLAGVVRPDVGPEHGAAPPRRNREVQTREASLATEAIGHSAEVREHRVDAVARRRRAKLSVGVEVLVVVGAALVPYHLHELVGWEAQASDVHCNQVHLPSPHVILAIGRGARHGLGGAVALHRWAAGHTGGLPGISAVLGHRTQISHLLLGQEPAKVYDPRVAGQNRRLVLLGPLTLLDALEHRGDRGVLQPTPGLLSHALDLFLLDLAAPLELLLRLLTPFPDPSPLRPVELAELWAGTPLVWRAPLPESHALTARVLVDAVASVQPAALRAVPQHELGVQLALA